MGSSHANMATNTFLEMTRSLRLHVPQLDEFLAQFFIRDRYRKIKARRDWSGLRAETQFILNPAKTAGTVAVTNNVTTVNGTGTAFASTDVGRQFKAGVGSPVYSITAVDVGLQILTLDLPYGQVTATGATYTIFDGYVTMPSDFKRILTAVDPQTGYKLRHWITQEQLLRWDPQRNFFGLPYSLVDRRFNTAGLVQYEAWPYNTDQRVVTLHYFKDGADLINDADVPIWPVRSDVIVTGALADLVRWPGTKENPNLMFGRMDIFKSFEAEFEDKMIDLERQDEEIYLTWLAQTDWDSWPWAPLSANFIQTHAL